MRMHTSHSAKGRFALAHGLVALGIVLAGVGVVPHALAYHFPWDQGHDTTDWYDPLIPGPEEDPRANPDDCENGQSTGSPVYVRAGHLVWQENLATLPGQPEIRLDRTYNSNDPRPGIFGNGWSSGCETTLQRTVENFGDGGSEIRYILRVGNGKRYVYRQAEDGSVVTPPGRTDKIVLPEDGSAAPVDLVAQDGSARRFDAAGRLIRRKLANGQEIRYRYDDAGRLARIESSGGRFLELTYSSAGRVTAVTDHAGRRWGHEYDSAGNLVRVTNPEGGVRRFSYRAFTPEGDRQTYYQLTRITDAAGVTVTEVTYDGNQVASYTEGANRFEYDYDPANATTTKTDRLGDQWTYGYNDHGVIVEKTNPAGETRRFRYDDDGNLVRRTDATGAEWTFTYDDRKRRLTATDPLDHTRAREYERSWPFPTATVSPSGRRTEIAYNDAAQPVLVRDPAGAETGLEYDDRGRLRAVEDALGNRSRITYDDAGRPLTLTDAEGRTRRLTYDAVGNVVAVERPDGATYRFTYDANRRLTSVTEPSGAITRFAYDAAGRRTAVTDPKDQTTRFEYDDHGRLVRRIAPDGATRTYRYRADNRLAAIERADGTTKTFAYDAAKRLAGIETPTGATTFRYNARGQLVEAANPAGTVSRNYDAAGRLVVETVNGEPVRYGYNADGEVTQRRLLGATIAYQRSARGRITAIDAPEGRYSLERDALGRRTGLTMPHGEAVSYAYNAAGELTGQTFTGPFSEDLGYDLDAQGRLTRWDANGFSWAYGYGADGQLTSATGSLGDYSYAYDAAGNPTGAGQVYDAANRLQEDAEHTYTYDDRGNLAEKVVKATGERWTYAWDGRNRLVERAHYPDATADQPDAVTEYTYGPLGRRWSRTQDGSERRFVYAGSDRVGTLDGTGGVAQRVTFGPRIDEPLALIDSGATRYLHADRQGSVVGASQVDGTATAYRYSPFGRLLNDPASLGNDFRYTGREAEGNGLYYYRARYYDAGMRRFLSPDPIGFGGGDTNLYRYVGNDPVNAIDPDGLETLTLGGTLRVPRWIGQRVFGKDYEGQGASVGVALSFPGFTGGKFDIGAFGMMHGGGQDFGIGKGTFNVGLHGGSVCDLAGQGSEISANIKMAGGGLNFDKNGNFTGGAIQIGPGYNVGGTGTITGTLSFRDGFEN